MTLINLALYAIPIITNAFLAIFIFLNNPKSKSNQYFTGLLVSMIVWIATLFLYYNITDNNILLYVGRINFVSTSLIAMFFSLFVINYPNKNRSKTNKNLTKIILIWTTILILFTLLTPLISVYEISGINETKETIYGPLYTTFIIHFIGIAILSMFILGRKYEKLHGNEKQKVGLVILGFTLATLLGTITNIVIPLIYNYFIVQELGPFLTLTMTGTITYAIVKHRFLDIRAIVARTVSSVLTMALISFFYASYLFIIGSVFTKTQIDKTQLIIAIVLALIISVTLQPIKKFIDKSTESIFFKRNYDSQKLLYDLGKITSSTFELKQLTTKILNEIAKTIQIENASIILFDEHKKIWLNGIRPQPEFKNLTIKRLTPLINRAKSSIDNVLIIDEVSNEIIKKELAYFKIVAMVPLFIKGKPIGSIILGRKKSGEIYTNKDIKIFKIFFPEMSLAINNALSYEQIKQFNVTLEKKVKEATAKLRKANKDLRELDTLKDEFVSIASHELRTPMTAIKSYLWMVVNKSKNINAKDKKYLKIAYDSTERLISLVNDMLVISRIEGNRLELHEKKFDIVQIANQVITELRFTAKEKKINLNLSTSSKKIAVVGDNAKISEVIQNIIGNALKFTPEKGKIDVKLKLVKDNVELTVTDTGPGIPKEDLPKLFTKFSKISYAYRNVSNVKGTGLGLYISKQIIGLHHGSIDVESKVGKGTTFTVTIPFYKE